MTVQNTIKRVSKALEGIPGIVGIVLGGSRARDTHHHDADIDIGIYYDEEAGFQVEPVGVIATQLDDEHHENLLTSLGEWGDWINGGGWLVVDGYHVDLIFRDIHKVSRVIDDSLVGNVTSHYHAGHPHAYLSVMYMGEIAICNILADPTNQIAELKEKTTPYPKPLQDAIVSYFMFEANFSLLFTMDNVDKDDISYVAGHAFRIISCLNQVLFALNENYCINEKKAVQMIEMFPIKPVNYKKRVDRLFTMLSADSQRTRQSIDLLNELVSETEKLVK
ncbi:nucleotidyltransferase domain-containing protein [Oceanobacillus halotolerans]|uniref:nucleotidyltransferase domain-containing protein n=1 Tax=Oceanobacillus halotolerans TaxID=2663380 RepID=UPI0013DBB4EB|nr:nucleotidyltransferase domain-containing protein [Oceanobacillus halotolerans]